MSVQKSKADRLAFDIRPSSVYEKYLEIKDCIIYEITKGTIENRRDSEKGRFLSYQVSTKGREKDSIITTM